MTADPTTVVAVSESRPLSSSSYDAFISYSHARDRHLAVALQSGLQRFAKPWYRRRALRVFRDESSLSATPALWPTIETALDASRSLILIASPESAQSHWVAQELQHWIDHGRKDRLILVLSDGVLEWDEVVDDFDREHTNALPDVLRGVFDDEPLHVDLAWARTADHVSLRDPRFREPLASIAAPLHGRSRDELIGEDLRQHRRTVRIATATIAIVAVLALVAAALGIVALQQRNEARSQRDEAQRQRDTALSGQLAAEAVAASGTHRDEALLLALAAGRTRDTVDARSALLTSLQASTGVTTHLHPEFPAMSLTYSPDGRTLAAGSSGAVYLWDVAEPTGKPELRAHGADIVTGVAFSPDGRTFATTGPRLGQVVLHDTATQREVARYRGTSGDSVAFSPGGRTIVIGGFDGTVVLRDIETGATIGSPLDAPDQRGPNGFDQDRRITALAFTSESQLVSGNAHAVVRWNLGPTPSATRIAPGATAIDISADGSRVAVGVEEGISIFDIASGRPSAVVLPILDSVSSLAWSPDGTLIAAGDLVDGNLTLWDVTTGRRVARPLGNKGSVVALDFTPDGRTLASAPTNGAITLWDVDALRDADRLEHGSSLGGISFSRDGSVLATSSTGVSLQLWDTKTRERLGPPIAGTANAGPVMFVGDTQVVAYIDGGELVMYDTRTRDRRNLATNITGLSLLAASRDGRLIATAEFAGHEVTVWDTATGKAVGQPFADPDGLVVDVAVAPAGNRLAVAVNRFTTLKPVAVVWDVDRHERIAEFEHPLSIATVAFGATHRSLVTAGDQTAATWDVDRRRNLRTITIGPNILSAAVNARGDEVAVSAPGQVTLWDLRTGRQLGSPFAYADAGSVLAWGQQDAVLAVGLGDGTVDLRSTSVEEWRRSACTMANRELTDDEWDELGSGPRPDLC